MKEFPIRILAVDDDQGVCTLTKEFLETFELLSVDMAFSVREAMATLANHRYDAIVSDYQMPEEDGIVFLRRLRAKGDHTPFILFTGKGREEIVIEAIDNGADAYLQKGAETRSVFTELAHKIREAVAKVRAETALIESEARYRSLIDGSSVGIFLTDINFDCIYSNRKWSEMISQTGDGPRGKGWMDGIHPEDIDSFKENWGRSIECGGGHSFEYRYLGRNDRITWIWGNAAPLKDAGGTITGYISTNVDITERKRVEEALLEKERTIAKASSLAKMGYWMWKADKGGITFSDGLSSLLGIPAGTTLPHDLFFEKVHPDDRKGVIAALEDTLKGKGDFNLEHRMIRSDGSVITVMDTVEVTTARGNRPVFILGMVQDISELKRVSEVLRDTEDLYRLVFDTIAEGVLVEDTHGRIIASNDEAARILGVPSKEALMTMDDLDWMLTYEDGKECPPIEFPANITASTGRALNNEVRGIRLGNGGIRWITINTRPLIQVSSTKPIAIVVSFADITRKKEAETELQQSENKYRMIAENMADVITVLDLGLHITYVSPSIINQRGYTAEEAMEQSLEEILTPASLELAHNVFSEEFENEMRQGESLDRTRFLEFEEYRKDGTTVWIGNAIRFVRDKDGRPTSIIVLSRDITEKRFAEDSSKEANRKLSLLSSITRHDILNQLQVLTGWLELVDSTGERKDEAKNRTMTAARNIEALIKFTGEYERLGSRAPGFIGIRKEVNKIVDKITLTGIEVINLLQDEDVLADPLLNKVFYNLIENAARHGEKATYIRFRTEVVDDILRVICEDDGKGIPAERKDCLFEKGRGKVLGLGLFFAREILSITDIAIHEEGCPGEGARFVITVPRGKWRRGC